MPTLTGSNASDFIRGTAGDDIIEGLGGNDTLQGKDGNDDVRGGEGDDNLRGDAGDDILSGGNGADYIVDDAGNDILDGGAGDDVIEGRFGSGRDMIYGGAGDDDISTGGVSPNEAGELIDGGEGNDFLWFVANYSTVGITFSLANPAADQIIDGVTIRNVEAIDLSASQGNDTLTGGTEYDRFYGNGGNDLIQGMGGNDSLDGGEGDDDLRGGDGDDSLDGGNGNDVVDGGAGNDSLHGYLLRGGDGDDSLRSGPTAGGLADGGAGIDFLFFYVGFSNANIVFSLADPAVDQIVGGTTIRNIERVDFTASEGNDTLTGGAYADTFLGGYGNDVIRGGDGNDIIKGEVGQDQLFGDGGDDALTYGWGDILLDGGSGVDKANINLLNDGTPVTLDISNPSVDQNVVGTVIRNVEQLNYTGGNAANQITGGGYDDFIEGGNAADILIGGGGNDILGGKDGIDQIFGGSGDDVIYAFETTDHAGDSLIDGGDGFDTLTLGLGNYSGFTSIDLGDSSGRFRNIEQITFSGSKGGNFGVGGSGNDTMNGNAGFDEYHGGAGDDYLTGELLYGDEGNDRLEAYGGDAALYGGAGNDSLRIVSAGSNVLDGGTGNDGIAGGAGADTLIGGEGNDYLDGDAGADMMTGGIGNDTYVIDNAGDVANEFADEGIDTIVTRLAAYTLGVVFENLSGNNRTDAPLSGQRLTGNDWANVITGGYGNDTIDGGVGADIMRGSNGDDIYHVDNAGDVVEWEWSDQGTDAVYAAVSYQLGADNWIEVLSTDSQTGTTALNLTGNNLSQFILGNAGANVLTGGGGSDYLVGLGGDDTLIGSLDAASTLQGGSGDDWYYVNHTGDSVLEVGGEGADRIVASVSFTLGAGQSVETIGTADQAGTAPINLTGNDLAQVIFGNAGANTLTGGGGADYLLALGGDDILFGNADAASTLQGGTGNDWYYIYRTGDSLVEFAGEGTDRIFTTVSYTLSAGQEIETLATADSAGAAAINLTGNALGQNIFGNAGANTLTGGGGTDTLIGYGGDDILFGNADAASTMQGGTGNDWYYITQTGDSLVEFAGEGNDRILTSVSYTLSAGQEIETLSALDSSGSAAINLAGNGFAQFIQGTNGANILSGDGGADVLAGLGGGDVLLGGDGDDFLNGGLGSDALNGGAGADMFVFADALALGNIDGIQDFVSGSDRIALDHNVFAGLSAGALSSGAFVTGTAAQDADDRILYDSATGALWFDADGNGAGAAVQFATLSGHPPIAASDFAVI
jgi:Ca2+-binding RTX toxin-like protein